MQRLNFVPNFRAPQILKRFFTRFTFEPKKFFTWHISGFVLGGVFQQNNEALLHSEKGTFCLAFYFFKSVLLNVVLFCIFVAIICRKTFQKFFRQALTGLFGFAFANLFKSESLCGCLQKGLAFPKNVVLLLNLLVVFRKQLFFHLSQKRQSFADCLSFFNLCLI